MMSIEGDRVVVNRSFARMHGYTVEEARNLRLPDLDTPETARLAPERLHRLLLGETMTFEVEHFRKDGEGLVRFRSPSDVDIKMSLRA